EVLIILKDIWGLDSRKMMSVAQWAAGALVRAAVMESVTDGGRSAPATATE
ncbi:MAG: TetR/AcrR family transcriptional regulator, partial [Mesorhizobium sp.]